MNYFTETIKHDPIDFKITKTNPRLTTIVESANLRPTDFNAIEVFIRLRLRISFLPMGDYRVVQTDQEKNIWRLDKRMVDGQYEPYREKVPEPVQTDVLEEEWGSTNGTW